MTDTNPTKPTVQEADVATATPLTPLPVPCSRCRRIIEGFLPPDGGMTAGYYVAAAWPQFANPGEVYICDACMWADPQYVAIYGSQAPSEEPEREPDPDPEEQAALLELIDDRDHRVDQIENIYYALGGQGEWSSDCDLGDEAKELADALDSELTAARVELAKLRDLVRESTSALERAQADTARLRAALTKEVANLRDYANECDRLSSAVLTAAMKRLDAALEADV